MKLKNKNKMAAAFSLVEMLVVIAVIGIIAAIAVPQIGDINAKAVEGKNKRNAQNIASVCASAQAAGLNFVGSSTAASDVIDAVVTGGKPASGPFSATYFGVQGMDAAEKTGAATYLSVANGVLVYDPTP